MQTDPSLSSSEPLLLLAASETLTIVTATCWSMQTDPSLSSSEPLLLLAASETLTIVTAICWSMQTDPSLSSTEPMYAQFESFSGTPSPSQSLFSANAVAGSPLVPICFPSIVNPH